jgi:uncharacterized protein YkwD
MIKRYWYLFFIYGVVLCALLYKDTLIPLLVEYRDTTLHPGSSRVVQRNTSKFLSLSPSPSPSPSMKKKTPVYPRKTTEEWGIAKEIEEGTYTIRVGNDASMGSPQEVLAALNAYRNTNGRSTLAWDDTLGRYAQSRAEYMQSIQTTDKHAGFNHYLEKDDGFNRLGFNQLGENSYYGGPLNGTHVIEWVFAKSPGHDANQKSSDWTHVGIGVTNSTVNLIFGGSKM